jgi:hypothetical protein
MKTELAGGARFTANGAGWVLNFLLDERDYQRFHSIAWEGSLSWLIAKAGSLEGASIPERGGLSLAGA